MQRLRMNEIQLYALAEKAVNDIANPRGWLFKRTDSNKWQLRFFVLYQNLFFYFENETSNRPTGLILLEGSYCNKVVQPSNKNCSYSQHIFQITFLKEGSKQYEFKSETESECNAWVHSIDCASFSKMLLLKEELEQKHLHLVQIVESEKTAKSHYTQQCEELTVEIKKLRSELCALKKEWRLTPNRSIEIEDESDDLRKIKKVQSFFRGWLCRRRWKQIVEEYINSPHAENMRKRNSLVFRMVEAEEEYVEQLQLLISCFLRPLKMAASSQKPPCTHDEVNSIFLNSETIMFLHQIFLKGLTARMEGWPTLVLGDLFDMLLPMLCIYQEYVRNHHFSLQVLAECKQKEKFAILLKRLEEKPLLQNRTLETFLTYPMHQVPRYIITLHELLAHTPHNHVERRSLDNAKSKLEELSRQMHDEVSETENIRKNLAIERIIIGGCDILLDVNQVFVRQGALLHLQSTEKHKHQRTRLGSFRGDRDVVRQCFLFTNHMLMCTRASNGKLHLAEHVGKIPLSEGTLIEDPNEQFQFIVDEPEGSMSIMGSAHGLETAIGTSVAFSGISTGKECGGLDFKIIWDCKTGPPIVIHLVAPTLQEKAAWTSDISQCIDNVHFNDLFHSTMSDSSSVTMPQSIRNDPRLYKDDVDIRFSRTLNSCKLPQIRYASPERLFERLTDLRFLSIDFLNTFLLTYRVFTDGVTVLEALKKVHYSPESQISNMISPLHDSSGSLEEINCKNENQPGEGINFDYDYSRRISATSMMSDMSDAHRESVVSTTSDTQLLANLQQAQQQISARNNQHWRLSYRKFEEEQAKERYLKRFGERPESDNSGHSDLLLSPGPDLTLPVPPPSPELPGTQINTRELGDDLEKTELSSEDSTSDCTVSDDSEDSEALPTNGNTLVVPVHSQSNDTLKAEQSSPNSPSVLSSATSSATLVGSDSKSVSPVLKDAPEELPTVRTHITEKSASLDGKEKTQSQLSSSILDSPLKSSSQYGQQTYQQQQRTTESAPKTVPQESSKIAGMSTYREVSFEPDLVTQSSSSSSQSAPTLAPTFPTMSNRVSSGTQPKVTGSRFSAGNHLVPLPASANFLRVKTTSKRGSSDNVYTTSESTGYTSSSTTPRSSFQTESTVLSTPRSSFQLPESPQMSSKAGVVVTSSRASTRRSSTASAASAFAVATAASSNPPDPSTRITVGDHTGSQRNSRHPSAVGSDLKIPAASNRVKRESVISTAATMRVLNVLRHWISKHSQDFENDPKLMKMTTEFLEELVNNPSLLPAEHKAASQLLQMITKEEQSKKIDLDMLLAPPVNPCRENFDRISAMEIAEAMTYLDHKIFISIQSGEFLGQAWMKNEKTTKAPHILLMTRRFNEVSRLVASEIMHACDIQKRVMVIEKWTAVADICRMLHNFNGVLQICAALTNSAIFRLKKTWDRISKTVKQTIEKLQSLVSTDGRFRNMREALHRCDPPCIPYLGMYLTDLSFIEEGTPNFTDDGLLNFSKMRMIAHVIREVKQYQQTPYKIEMNSKAINYLLDTSRHLSDDELYHQSLILEPRLSRLGTNITPTSASSSFSGTSPSHRDMS